MMSPTPKPEDSEATALEACSRSRRFPANASKTSPRVMTSVPPINVTPCRVPSCSGWRIASGRSESERRGDAEDHRETHRQPNARDPLAEAGKLPMPIRRGQS